MTYLTFSLIIVELFSASLLLLPPQVGVVMLQQLNCRVPEGCVELSGTPSPRLPPL